MPLTRERRRAPPSPLKLYVGPTPLRGTPKYKIPSMPSRVAHPLAGPSSSPTSSSSPSQSSSSSETENAGIDWDKIEKIVPSPLAMLPTIMTRGPSHGSTVQMGAGTSSLHRMPEFVEARRTIANGGLGLGPWDRTTKKFSWEEVDGMLQAPKPAVANPAPIVFNRL